MPDNLTKRQLEIVKRLAEGQTRKEIASDLGISEKTVAFHFSGTQESKHRSIYARTGSHCMASVIAFAWRTGLVSCLVLSAIAQAPSVPMSVTLPPNTNGACARLAWDYPTNAVNGISGFKVYYGIASRNYTNSIGLNRSTMFALPASNLVTFTNRTCGLVVTQRYYFAVSAYDASGAESDYSNEVLWQSPALKTNRIITLSVATNGTATGEWRTDARFNSITLTNPTGPEIYFKVAITQTNT